MELFKLNFGDSLEKVDMNMEELGYKKYPEDQENTDNHLYFNIEAEKYAICHIDKDFGLDDFSVHTSHETGREAFDKYYGWQAALYGQIENLSDEPDSCNEPFYIRRYDKNLYMETGCIDIEEAVTKKYIEIPKALERGYIGFQSEWYLDDKVIALEMIPEYPNIEVSLYITHPRCITKKCYDK